MADESAEKVIPKTKLLEVLKMKRAVSDKAREEGGRLGQKIAAYVENDNLDRKAMNEVYKRSKMGEFDREAYKRNVEIYEEMAVEAGFMPKHVGDLSEMGGGAPGKEKPKAEGKSKPAPNPDKEAADKNTKALAGMKKTDTKKGADKSKGADVVPLKKPSASVKEAADRAEEAASAKKIADGAINKVMDERARGLGPAGVV